MDRINTTSAIASENGLEIRGSLLARNTVLNFVSAVAPLVIAVATIPYVIRGLGPERFGILALCWVMGGYLGFLNLGLGPATTKFVAELLGKGETHRLPVLVWTSVSLSAILGTIAGITLATVTPFLIGRLFKLPSGLAGEAHLAFLLIALSFPVVFAISSLRGVLEAAQRFDLLTTVNLPLNSANFLIPAAAVWLGFSLPAIVGFLLLSKFASALAYLALDLRILPGLRQAFRFDRKVLRPLLSFGGWVSVAAAIGPIIAYLDRFLIGALISMAAVAYYAAPYEAVMRSAVLPGCLVGVLFPAFSTLTAGGQHARVEDLFVRSTRYLLLVWGPLVILMVAFARDILAIWLGAEFARQSTLAFQILAVGMLASSILWVPHVLLQAIGRPDIPTKFLLLQLPIYMGLAWCLIAKRGISGAALAWTLRACLSAVLLFGACAWLRLASFRSLLGNRMPTILGMLAGLAGSLAMLSAWASIWPTRAAFAVALALLYALVAWRHALDPQEEASLRIGLSRLLPSRLPKDLRSAPLVPGAPGQQSTVEGPP
jgi:O-antigen/teichoic acid export membrane protein